MDLDKVKALYNNVTPQVRDLFNIFIKRCREDNITISAGHLAYVTLLSLVPFIVALMLISNVDKTLNRIWRTQSDRPIVYTFAIYWMVITLGPMLIGSSVVVSSYLTGLAAFTEEYTPGLGTFLLSLVPSGAAMLAFTILYMVVPNRRVFARHALVGAIVATIAFEITKSGFALYVTNFPSYELIYGALAVVPILFLWVYLSWVIVLFGAEFTCSLGEAFENRKAENEPRKVPQE